MNEHDSIPEQTPNGAPAAGATDSTPLTTHYSHFNFQRVLRLARKELREILRDRRTIVTLIAMPLLLYPLMSVAFQQFYLASRLTSGAIEPEYRFGAVTNLEQRVFQERFDRGQDVKETPNKEPKTHLSWDHANREPVTAAERAERLEKLKELLRDGKIDLIVTIPDVKPDDVDPRAPGVRRDRFLPCRIYAMPNNGPSRAALARIESALAAANEHDLKERLDVPGVTPRVALLSVHPVMLETPGGDGIISLAALVPLILILMTITGAVYPAIDLTAGERERGTLEILVAAPVSRFELLSAKYASVVTVAVLNAIVNLACMAITVKWSGLGSVLIQGGLSFGLLLQVFALLLLFAAFFSAVLLCLTSFARSFKEAQSYLIPLMLASLAPGIMAMMPGLELDGVLAVVPLVNVVLLARDLFGAEIDPMIATIVILTTLLYALAALSLAARVFGAEGVLYSEQNTWGDLWRRPDAPQPAASIPSMLWCLALMVPIQFALLALLRSLGAIPPILGLFVGMIVNLLLFGLLPAFFAYFGRVNFHSGIGIATPRPAAIAGGLVLGLSLWPLQLWILAQTTLPDALEERFNVVLEEYRRARENIGWMILLTVIVPAILEEFFFRGLLFNALKARCGPIATIGTTSLLFGITHVIIAPGLGMERLFSSTVLGLILGAVCWHTGSVWPGMIQHACHNAILLGVGIYNPGSMEEIPWHWLVIGAAGAVLGAVLLGLWGRSKPLAA